MAESMLSSISVDVAVPPDLVYACKELMAAINSLKLEPHTLLKVNSLTK